jgi:hypothetical protein
VLAEKALLIEASIAIAARTVTKRAHARPSKWLNNISFLLPTLTYLEDRRTTPEQAADGIIVRASDVY